LLNELFLLKLECYDKNSFPEPCFGCQNLVNYCYNHTIYWYYHNLIQVQES